MANYVETNISKQAFLALIDSKIDQNFVREVATGSRLRINDLKNPINARDLQIGISNGVYEAIELSYPKSFLEKNDNWFISGIDYESRLAMVVVQAASGDRYLVCKLNADRFKDPCRTVFCQTKESFYF